jgi:signal transduction histidine kinase
MCSKLEHSFLLLLLLLFLLLFLLLLLQLLLLLFLLLLLLLLLLLERVSAGIKPAVTDPLFVAGTEVEMHPFTLRLCTTLVVLLAISYFVDAQEVVFVSDADINPAETVSSTPVSLKQSDTSKILKLRRLIAGASAQRSSSQRVKYSTFSLK